MRKPIRPVIASFLIIALSGCGLFKPYDFETAVERGDIVSLHGKVSNVTRLEEFNQNIAKDVKDKVRITQFTIEGDPIFYDIKFNGKEIKVKYDNSKDKYGKSDVQSTTCKSFIAKEIKNGVEYSFNECSGKNKDMGNDFKFEVIEE